MPRLGVPSAVAVLWERETHQRPFAAGVSIANGRVVVLERDTRVACLEAETGKTLWDIPGPSSLVQIVGDSCLLRLGGRLTLVNFSTGEIRYQIRAANLPYYGLAPTAVVRDVVLTGGWRGYSPVRALDLSTGELLWQRQWTTVPAVPWRGGALVGNRWHVWLINPRSGEELDHWTPPVPLAETARHPVFTVIDDNHVLIRCDSRSLYCLYHAADPATTLTRVEPVVEHWADLAPVAPQVTGDIAWIREVKGGHVAVEHGVQEGPRIRPVERRRASGAIIGGLARYQTGQTKWRVDPGEPVIDGVVPIVGGYAIAGLSGTLCLVGNDGNLQHRTSVAYRPSALRALGPNRLLILAKGSLKAVEVRGT